jgi:hypothetical protein
MLGPIKFATIIMTFSWKTLTIASFQAIPDRRVAANGKSR